MAVFPNEFVKKIYNLPKTAEAVSDFLNSEYEEVQPDGTVKKRLMWERFEGSYVKVSGYYVEGTSDDDAAVYMLAHKLISKCVLGDVSPYFESDGQLFAYFQLMVRSTRINEQTKERKNTFTLISELVKDDGKDEQDLANFEERLLEDPVSSAEELASMDAVNKLIECLDDPDLVLFGKLLVRNDFSYDGMYGLCGFDLQKFRDVKRRFVKEMKELYQFGK